MINYMLQGLLFGLAYVAPIGTQNLYVINSATSQSRWRAYQVALITVFFDITLAISCFFGIGLLIEHFLLLKAIIILIGSIVVVYIGVNLIREKTTLTGKEPDKHSMMNIIGTCFAVTWLNPQAIIDGSLLLGSFHATLPPTMSVYFVIGVCGASLLWFNLLATLVLTLRAKFQKAIHAINIICGLVLIFYGLKLAYSFFLLII